MSAVRSFVKREPVLILAALAAVISCFFVPPDETYLNYIDFRTLALLYSLMTVVAGLRQAGLFSHLEGSPGGKETVYSVRRQSVWHYTVKR